MNFLTFLVLQESRAGCLQQNFDESQRSLQQYQIQHAETLNRLTAQLEESQRQCRDLLGQGVFGVVIRDISWGVESSDRDKWGF